MTMFVTNKRPLSFAPLCLYQSVFVHALMQHAANTDASLHSDTREGFLSLLKHISGDLGIGVVWGKMGGYGVSVSVCMCVCIGVCISVWMGAQGWIWEWLKESSWRIRCDYGLCYQACVLSCQSLHHGLSDGKKSFVSVCVYLKVSPFV